MIPTNKKKVSLIILLSAGMLLCSCSPSETVYDYPYSNNNSDPFSLYNSSDLSKMEGLAEGQIPQTQEPETEPEPETVVETEPVPEDLTYKYIAFDDGAEGLQIQANGDSEFLSIPTALTNQSFHEQAAGGYAKLMTAYVALKHLKPEDEVVYSSVCSEGLENAKKASFEEGLHLTVDDLMYSMFVGGANNCAVCLATEACGSEEAFISEMNETAAALGMKHTQYTNVTGLDSDGYHTTVYDTYLLIREAAKYDCLLEYIQDSYVKLYCEDADGNESEYEFINENEFVNQQFEADNVIILGATVSHTSLSGYCAFLYYMDVEGQMYFAFVQNAPGYSQVYSDMRTIVSE